MSSSVCCDVFFFEAFEEEASALRKLLPDSIRAEFTWKTIQEAGLERLPAHLISTRTQSELPVAWAEELQGILSRSTGYNHLLAFLEKTTADIACGYLPLYCNRAVAEQAMLLWMALLRKLPRQMTRFRTFHRDGLSGKECTGKNLLVVGVGNIGYEVVQIGQGLGMNVKGVDLIKKHGDVTYTDLETGLQQSDIVVCAMNLTKENTGFFDYATLRKSRPGSIFINIARGEMSPVADMLRLVQEKHLGGLALDVYEDEGTLATALRSGKSVSSASVQAVMELLEMDNVILTPHNAFNSLEAVQRKAEQSVQQVIQFLKEKTFIWNIPGE